MILQFIQDCKDHQHLAYQNFGMYFEEYYARRYYSWIDKCRNIVPTTNMALENFHKQLKYHDGTMDGKKNQRIDTLLDNLVGFQSIQWAWLSKMDALGAVNNETTKLNFWEHKKAKNQNNEHVYYYNEFNKWMVKSFNENVYYEVGYTGNTCPHEYKCQSKCRDCLVCWHELTCTCPMAENFHNRKYSCKHAHLVVI